MSRLIKLSRKDCLFYGLPCVYNNGHYVLFSPYLKKTVILGSIDDKADIKREIEQEYGSSFFGKPLSRKLDKSYKKLTLITTTDCNLACRYCSVRAGEKKDLMTSELAKKAVDEVINKETKKIKVIFFGGEPTLNFKCISETVYYVKSLGIDYEFSISTNGIISEEVIKFLCKNNFIIHDSADGIPSVQDYQRPLLNGAGSSGVVERTISLLVRNNACFKIRETVTNLNVKNMAESVKYYAGLGVKYIFFEPLIQAGKAVGHKKIKAPRPPIFIKEFDRALNQAAKLDAEIGNSLLINLLHPSTHYCGAALGETLTITPKGVVTACTAIQDDCSNLADIMVTGSYNFNNQKFEYDLSKIRNLCKHNVEQIKKCSDCFAKYICSGGCIIRNLVKSGSLAETNDEYCEIRKGLLKLVIIKTSGKRPFYKEPAKVVARFGRSY